MNRNRIATVVLATFIIAGCGSSGSGGESGDAAPAAGGAMMPGQWQSQLTLTKIDAPSAPDMKEFFADAIGHPQESTSCLTEEQAAKPDAGFFQGENANCTYETFTMSDGKIESAMTCDEGDSAMKVTMTGTYTPESYEISSTAEGNLMPDTPGTMAMTATGKRVGDCAPETES